MIGWNQRTLVGYTPTSSSDLTFYYLPMTGKQQDEFRAQFSALESPLALASAVFCARNLMFRVYTESRGEKYYTWPEDFDEQTYLLSRIPEDTVMEIGYSILGWNREPEEEGSTFLARVLAELQKPDSYEV